MKSKSVAALLALFFPFIGVAYASGIKAALFVALAGFFLFCYIESSLGLMGLLFVLTYVVSIFSAVKSVERFNLKLLEAARAQ